MFNFCIHTHEICDGLEEIKSNKKNQTILYRVQAGEAAYRKDLGWHCVDEWVGEAAIEYLEELAVRIRKQADVFVLIGVGGSNNGARAVVEALKTECGPEIIYAGNTLSPISVEGVIKRIKGKSAYMVCIAKNFETLEPGVTFRLLRQYFYQWYGEKASERIFALGTKGSSLETLCKENGYTFLEFPQNVGGRYSAITNVGLFPMAVAGIDVRALVQGAKRMQEVLQSLDAEKNPAYEYACMRMLCYQRGYRIELLSCFEPRMRYFYNWWRQLFAESEGKDGKGIFPATAEFSEELHSIGQYIQEGSPILFETFLDIADGPTAMVVKPDSIKDGFDYLNAKSLQEINRVACEATKRAHSMRVPCMEIRVGALDAWHFGQLFYFFQFACYMSCRLMEVEPFNQPGVEDYKNEMFMELKK